MESMPPPWSVENVRARILARLEELNLTLEDLPSSVRKGVGVNGWAKGPTIETLRQVADALRMTVPALLGAAPPPLTPCDEQTLEEALQMMIDVLAPNAEDCPIRLQTKMAAKLTCSAYSMLMIAAQERPDIAHSEAGKFMVLSYIRNSFAAEDLKKS